VNRAAALGRGSSSQIQTISGSGVPCSVAVRCVEVRAPEQRNGGGCRPVLARLDRPRSGRPACRRASRALDVERAGLPGSGTGTRTTCETRSSFAADPGRRSSPPSTAQAPFPGLIRADRGPRPPNVHAYWSGSGPERTAPADRSCQPPRRALCWFSCQLWPNPAPVKHSWREAETWPRYGTTRPLPARGPGQARAPTAPGRDSGSRHGRRQASPAPSAPSGRRRRSNLRHRQAPDQGHQGPRLGGPRGLAMAFKLIESSPGSLAHGQCSASPSPLVRAGATFINGKARRAAQSRRRGG